MTRPSHSQKFIFSYLFVLVAGLTLLIWILRGLQILGFLPGFILWILLLLSITLGVLSQVSR